MQLFFSSLSELEHFTHRLKTLPKDNACEHCARNDQWVSHGYVYKQLCRNLCYASLIEAARETRKIVTITHVNNVLVQPHWRSHEELIKQQVA